MAILALNSISWIKPLYKSVQFFWGIPNSYFSTEGSAHEVDEIFQRWENKIIHDETLTGYSVVEVKEDQLDMKFQAEEQEAAIKTALDALVSK